MASSSGGDRGDPIPLQDLSGTTHHRTRRRSRSLLHHGAEIGRRLSTHLHQRSYDRLDDGPLPPVPDLQVPRYGDDGDDAERMRGEVDTALGTAGGRGSWLPARNHSRVGTRTSVGGENAHVHEPVVASWTAPITSTAGLAAYDDDNDGYGYDDISYVGGGGGVRGSSGSGGGGIGGTDDDSAPLAENQAPIAGAEERLSTRFAPGTSLGDDLHAAEEGLSRSRSKASGSARPGSLTRPTRSRSLSPTPSPVRRVSVAVQNISQRVVNLSNDPEAVEQKIRLRGPNKRYSGSRKSVPEIEIQDMGDGDGDGGRQEKKPQLLRKPSQDRPWREQANPLKGNTLRIFSPTSRVRLILCDVLIHP